MTAQLEERVLVFAPLGRDSVLACEVLARAGIDAVACRDARALCEEIRRGAAAVIVSEEALSRATLASLGDCLHAQPPWSDLPLLVLAHLDAGRASIDTYETLATLGNVSVLERPMRIVVLLTAVRTALRARKRQTEVRDLLEELERGVRDRDAFLATLGHELRNPLGAIRSALELLDRVRSPSDTDARERSILRRQAHHLAHLVDDLLDASRVTSGKIVLRREPTNLSEIVRRGVEAVSLGDRAGHDLRVVLCREPVFVVGDPIRLEQVVSNLLTNAVKYTPAGRRIDVLVAAEGGDAVLTVRDDGVGLAPEMLPRVFDLFTQAEGTLDRSQGGLGIGLTLVRRLVELHDGAVDVSSDGVGRGSVFRVRLPRCAHVEERLEPPQGIVARAKSRSVLLVEDNEDIRESLGMLLEHMGFEVRVAVDGPSGVAEAERRPPDAALVDIGLPGFDGYEVARRLRQTIPKAMLVALTGYGQPDDRRRSHEAGFDAHLTKPVDIDVLTAMLGG